MNTSATRRLTGGRALAEMLKLHRAGPMFGMAGFQLLPFYHAMQDVGLDHTLVNDERCGAFAADAWARITGRPGICDGTLGPGATNLVTGLVESLNAGVPVIALTGNSNRDYSWKNMTQEARQTEILAPAVKALLRVERIQRVPEFVRRAYQIATSGRPGPVVLDVPEDIAHGEHGFATDDLYADETATAIPARRIRPDAALITRAAALLRDARRPVILAGGGVHLSGAHEALAAFADAFDVPVAHTMSGKGSISCAHRLSLGLFGRYDRIANDILTEADCILVVGCKLGEIATKRYTVPPKHVPLIHVDIVAEEIGRCARADVALWGDAAASLADLHAELSSTAARQRQARTDFVRECAGKMQAWREGVLPRLTSDEVPVNMARLCHELNNVMPEDAILVADGGFAAHWTGLLFDTKRAGRGFVPNRGFASIGYGLPGAIGAQLAAGRRSVVSLTGDAGLNMMIGELETAKRSALPFTLVVVNNAASGYVKALQQALFGGHFQSSDLHELDYADIARAYGCQGIRVTEPDDLAPALRAGLAERRSPTVIDVVVTRDPKKMLPGVDNRAVQAKQGDRIA